MPTSTGKLARVALRFVRSIEFKEVPLARLQVRHGARADISADNGGFPLTLAAEKSYHLLVRDNCDSGKEPNVKNRSGTTVLFIAAVRGHNKVVEVLLNGGANKRSTE